MTTSEMKNEVIAVVILHQDGTTTTFQTDGWAKFRAEVVRMAGDPFYTRSPWARIFTSCRNEIEEHSLRVVREDLAREEVGS